MARIDGIIILDSNGKPLITSNFTTHPPSYAAIHVDAFNHALSKQRAALAAKDTEGEVAELEPVIWVNSFSRTGGSGGSALCHIERDGLRYLVPISTEVNPLFAFAFLESFLDTLREYLGEVTEGTVKDNFDIVYMLIEEMLDEGHPMTMETNMLKDIVIPPSLVRKLLNVAGVSGMQNQQVAPFTAPIPWRRPGVRHSNNEIYFDIEESLDAILDRKGKLLSSQVWGAINCNSRLSGNPDLLLTFANKGVMGEPAFHPCIRYNRWERDTVLSFIPPDGKFKLLEYEAPGLAQVPLALRARVTTDAAGGKFSLTLTSRLTHRALEDVTVTICLGRSAASVSATPTGDRRPAGHVAPEGVVDGHVGGGTFEFDPNTKVLRWHLASLTATERAPTLTGSFVSNGKPTPDPAFQVSFSVPNHTYSGLRVDQLKVLGDVGYKPFKGVRTGTKGHVEVRW